MNGKGSTNRTANMSAFREGYERIFAKSKPADAPERPERRTAKQAADDMESFVNRLYWTMFNERWGDDCHAFLEFCGLMSKFAEICKRAQEQGIDFRHANKHLGEPVPMEAHDGDYLGDKFDCIFGPSLRANPEALEAFLSHIREPKSMDEAERMVEAGYEMLSKRKAKKPKLRDCEACGGNGPTLYDGKGGLYLCRSCHSEPDDIFFRERS